MRVYTEDPISDERSAWSTIVVILVVLIIILMIGYFAWWAPSRQGTVVVTHPHLRLLPYAKSDLDLYTDTGHRGDCLAGANAFDDNGQYREVLQGTGSSGRRSLGAHYS